MNQKMIQAISNTFTSLSSKLQNDLQSLFDTYSLGSTRFAQALVAELEKIQAEEDKETVKEASEKA